MEVEQKSADNLQVEYRCADAKDAEERLEVAFALLASLILADLDCNPEGPNPNDTVESVS